jgi:hypothetical protein
MLEIVSPTKMIYDMLSSITFNPIQNNFIILLACYIAIIIIAKSCSSSKCDEGRIHVSLNLELSNFVLIAPVNPFPYLQQILLTNK